MPKALIVSVGGSEDPIVKSILEHNPDYICFFCSQGSVDKIAVIKNKVLEERPEFNFQDYKIVVDDANDLEECYLKARGCKKKLDEWEIKASDVVIDYTCGTKNMSVALAFATLDFGYEFSYVGGRERTKGGLGIVISGTEELRVSRNPWNLFALGKLGLIEELFNRYRFQAVRQVLGEVRGRNLDRKLEQFFEILDKLCEAYFLWDTFRHAEAAERMKLATKELTSYVDYGGREQYRGFLHSVQGNLDWLGRIREKTQGGRCLDEVLVVDLFANASRRAEEEKFDDAVARLYRTIEMCAQVEAEKRYGMRSSEILRGQVPEELRDEYVRKYEAEENGKLKVPLKALFRLLEAKGSEVGKVFMERHDKFKEILHARNNSILAHGVSSVKKEAYHKFYDLVCDFLLSVGYEQQDMAMQFAKLELNPL
ncbi:MAG: TIGR02710 family CRISPR-associated CARF protein [Acidobacteriota bacterium]|nr:TIGR02710 family CRISPR-associated CARF protein [Blastocatellia bacterium]MDW8413161.1 TIGR02710 family CRISPR-associated CARF protein [Acidobacteriota bacterium]